MRCWSRATHSRLPNEHDRPARLDLHAHLPPRAGIRLAVWLGPPPGGLVGLADGRRVLLAGTTQIGKTTTIIRLLLDGAQVHGDEYVLVRDAVAIAVPRLMRLEPRTIALLPELALAQLLPELPDGSARMLDPSWIAGDWSIDAGPIDEVIVLDGRGERARLQPAAATDVMPDSSPRRCPMARTPRPCCARSPGSWDQPARPRRGAGG